MWLVVGRDWCFNKRIGRDMLSGGGGEESDKRERQRDKGEEERRSEQDRRGGTGEKRSGVSTHHRSALCHRYNGRKSEALDLNLQKGEL